MRQGKASGGSTSTNSSEGEMRGKWKTLEEEKGKFNTQKEEWNSPKGKWNPADEHRQECNIAEDHKQTWNSPEEHKQEWDSLVQHMDRKTISLKVSVPPRPEDKKRKKLRRDVRR